MREIKFRSWDKVKNKMFNVFGMKWNTNHEFIISNDEWNGKDVWCPGESYSDIVMQYTLLKDKNGKEIYEGDIVKSEYSPHKQWWIDQIIFRNGAFMKKGIRVSHKLVWNSDVGDEQCVYKEEGFPYNELTTIGNNNGISNCEIIGNIYENTELIK